MRCWQQQQFSHAVDLGTCEPAHCDLLELCIGAVCVWLVRHYAVTTALPSCAVTHVQKWWFITSGSDVCTVTPAAAAAGSSFDCFVVTLHPKINLLHLDNTVQCHLC